MTRVTIELKRTETPILGTVYVEAEPDRPFVGWIGLLAALEAVLDADSHPCEDCAPREPRE